MIILLYGANSYSRGKKLKEILAAKADLEKVSLGNFDCENDKDAISGLRDFMSLSSMFQSKKIAVLEEPFETKDKKILKKIVEENILSKDVLMILSSSTKPPESFSFLLEKKDDKSITSQTFPDIKKGEEMELFIKKEALTRGVELRMEEIKLLADIFGNDLWAISTELDKIAVVGFKDDYRKVESDYFKLINNYKGGKNVRDKIVTLEILLSDRGDEPAKIFNMLGAGFGNGPSVDVLADYDVMIKSGKMDYEEALLALALKE